LFILYKH